jgi:hypothetical protein
MAHRQRNKHEKKGGKKRDHSPPISEHGKKPPLRHWTLATEDKLQFNQQTAWTSFLRYYLSEIPPENFEDFVQRVRELGKESSVREKLEAVEQVLASNQECIVMDEITLRWDDKKWCRRYDQEMMNEFKMKYTGQWTSLNKCVEENREYLDGLKPSPIEDQKESKFDVVLLDFHNVIDVLDEMKQLTCLLEKGFEIQGLSYIGRGSSHCYGLKGFAMCAESIETFQKVFSRFVITHTNSGDFSLKDEWEGFTKGRYIAYELMTRPEKKMIFVDDGWKNLFSTILWVLLLEEITHQKILGERLRLILVQGEEKLRKGREKQDFTANPSLYLFKNCKDLGWIVQLGTMSEVLEYLQNVNTS